MKTILFVFGIIILWNIYGMWGVLAPILFLVSIFLWAIIVIGYTSHDKIDKITKRHE